MLLSARAIGPAGEAYGLDMTEEMLALVRENQRTAGVGNVEFLKGEIENIPLPDGSVDVVISNCAINLSGDKNRVLPEAFRVLKPGGRFAVSPAGPDAGYRFQAAFQASEEERIALFRRVRDELRHYPSDFAAGSAPDTIVSQ